MVFRSHLLKFYGGLISVDFGNQMAIKLAVNGYLRNAFTLESNIDFSRFAKK